jgi:hypothetical protein
LHEAVELLHKGGTKKTSEGKLLKVLQRLTKLPTLKEVC